MIQRLSCLLDDSITRTCELPRATRAKYLRSGAMNILSPFASEFQEPRLRLWVTEELVYGFFPTQYNTLVLRMKSCPCDGDMEARKISSLPPGISFSASIFNSGRG